jgi:hypothetical protein
LIEHTSDHVVHVSLSVMGRLVVGKVIQNCENTSPVMPELLPEVCERSFVDASHAHLSHSSR